jgi:NAD(P)-dependent dehydrogenase (short-subunit alcohol dehydrogenase family)
MRDVAGKVAVVTGGASGIGLAMAKRFAAEQMKVVLADVEEPALAAAEKELRELGAEVMGIATDVSLWDSVAALAQATFDRFGTAHVVCNNAGVGPGGVTWDLSPSVWEWVIGVDLFGVIHGIRAFVPRLVAQGEGHVVNTSSYVGGLFGAGGNAPYCAAKFGVLGISSSLAADLRLAQSPVKVTALCPGGTRTRMNESGRNWPTRLGPPPTTGLWAGHPGRRPAAAPPGPSTAVDPSVVADAVFDAIVEERFWVITDPNLESDMRPYTDGMLSGELWLRAPRSTGAPERVQ